MSRVLLILPPFRNAIYSGGKTKVGVPSGLNLTLAVLAGALLKEGHDVKILDLDLPEEGFGEKVLSDTLKDFLPDFAGITFNTPTFSLMVMIAGKIRRIDPKVRLIGGGPHASALPEDTLKESPLDIVVIGEGDLTFAKIAGNHPLDSISGIAYRDKDEIKINPPAGYIEDLDSLAFPAWHLFDMGKYRTPRILARKNPAGWIETSRGCPFSCCFCTKSVFGRTFRAKSPKRVVDEIEHMLKIGFREIHISDDMFTTDIGRVIRICDEITSRRLKFPWATVTGIRVDRADDEMFRKMHDAGCYRIYLGIESGNQKILDTVNKGITLEQSREIVRLARKNKIETCGFFMLGLPGETEETMEETIVFACSLGLDYAKTTIATPLPSTPMFEQLEKEGRIKSKDWDKYNLYEPSNEIYDHPNLDRKTLDRYFNRFYRRFYFRPQYLLHRTFKGIAGGTFFYDIYYMMKTKW